MQAEQILETIQTTGGQLVLINGKLKAKRLTNDTRTLIKQHRTEIISLLTAQSIPATEYPKPYIKNGSELIIPTEVNLKYRWWDGGQSIFDTLLELDAPDTLIEQHVSELGSPEHWRRWQKILKKRIASRRTDNKSYTELFADLKPEDVP